MSRTWSASSRDGLPVRECGAAELPARSGYESADSDERPLHPRRMASCPGRLLAHADGRVAGCTLGAAGCRGRDLPHEGTPVRCWTWTREGCAYCGVQQTMPRHTRGATYLRVAVKGLRTF